jgi:hypothetical protein
MWLIIVLLYALESASAFQLVTCPLRNPGTDRPAAITAFASHASTLTASGNLAAARACFLQAWAAAEFAGDAPVLAELQSTQLALLEAEVDPEAATPSFTFAEVWQSLMWVMVKKHIMTAGELNLLRTPFDVYGSLVFLQCMRVLY